MPILVRLVNTHGLVHRIVDFKDRILRMIDAVPPPFRIFSAIRSDAGGALNEPADVSLPCFILGFPPRFQGTGYAELKDYRFGGGLPLPFAGVFP